MKLGIVGTGYNTGISHIAWGFAENFDSKTLLVHYKDLAMFPERFKEHRITAQVTEHDIDWILTGIDCLFTIETPYNWDIYKEAKRRGIRTVLMPMYEWLDRGRPELQYVDLFICPSQTTFEKVKGNKVRVPCEVPIDLRHFEARTVTKAKTFLHNSGHGGLFGRNSTKELLEAIPKVKSDVKFIINSQYPLNKVNDPRITYNEQNYENYWEMYDEGDVYILLGKYGVAYLGIQEAAAAGMPIMFTDMEPFNSYLPKDLLVKPKAIVSTNIYKGQLEDMAFFDIDEIARRIDEVAQMDLTNLSLRSQELAKEASWDTWKDIYYKWFYEKTS